MLSHKLYYNVKPFIPRSVQILVRRMIVQRKRKLYEHIWPIDERASKPPEGWTGWPDGRKFALVLLHDVDTEKGHEKCLELMKLDEEMGFRSSFNFVPERYHVSSEVRRILVEKGFEVGVHGLRHDGKLFSSRKIFEEQAVRINQYLKDWQSVGFVSPSMHRNLEWIHDLNVEYDASTFDTDPFEPQPDGVGTIFPFWVPADGRASASNLQPPTVSVESLPPTSNLSPRTSSASGYIELPYTLPQDFTLFIIMNEKNIDIWKKKLDWIAGHGGMALLITHPDYMGFNGKKPALDEYPAEYYKKFLEYIKETYEGQCWNALPQDVAPFWRESQCHKRRATSPPKSEVTLIDPIKDPRWDVFVESHPFGWICHLSGWKQVLEASFPHMKGYHLALVDHSNKIQAGLPLFEVRSWLTGDRLVSIPFATLCDPLVSSVGEMEALLDAAKKLSKDLRTSYIEIRTTNSHFFMKDPQFTGNYSYKNHYLELNQEVEKLWKSLHRKAVRQEINRANKNKLTLKIGESEGDLTEFYGLYVKTRKRLGLPAHPYPFLKSLWVIFGPTKRMILCLAKHQNQLIGGHIIFRFNRRVSAEFEGWNKAFHKFSPNHFLFWEEIKSANKEGFKIYDFGRTSSSNTSLMAFKGHWGTIVIDLPIFSYPREVGNRGDGREDSLSYKLVSQVCRFAPEPVLRKLGEFCYKHLG